MRIRGPARSLLLCVALSPFALSGALQANQAKPFHPGAPEPGGPLQTSATLVTILDPDGLPQAVVRVNILSTTQDVEARLMTAEKGSRGERRLLAKTSLTKGKSRSLKVLSALTPDRENHLLYEVEATAADGTVTHATVYLRVNLDQSLEPTLTDGYIQYQGAPGEEVRR